MSQIPREKQARSSLPFEKEFKEQLIFDRPKRNSFSQVIVIATILGFLGGILSTIILRAYSPDFVFPNLPPTPVQKTQTSSPPKVTMRDGETIEQTRKTLIRIYKKNNQGVFLSPDYLLGIGVALTSDGWLVVPYDIIKDTPQETLLLIGNGREASIEKKIIDPLTNLVFIKTKRDNFQVVPFAMPSELAPGASLLAFEKDSSFRFRRLRDISTHGASTPTSSETLDVFLTLDPEDIIGTILFTERGELVGLVNRSKGAVSVEILKETMASAIKKGEIKRPKLGVNFVDLKFLAPQEKNIPENGAILTRGKNFPAILRGSAAEKAGLKEGDVILSFDKIDIGPEHSLPQTLSLYMPGVEITIKIWREGEILEKKVILK